MELSLPLAKVNLHKRSRYFYQNQWKGYDIINLSRYKNDIHISI